MTELENFRVEKNEGMSLRSEMKKIEKSLAFADGEPVIITIYIDNPDSKKGFIEYIQSRYGSERVKVFTDDLSSFDIFHSDQLHIFDVDLMKWGKKINLGRAHFVRVGKPSAGFLGGNATFVFSPPRDLTAPLQADGTTGSPDFQSNAPDTFDFSSTVIRWPYSSQEVEEALSQNASS